MSKDQAQRLLDTAIGIILAEGHSITYPLNGSCICQEPHGLVVRGMKEGWPDMDDPPSEWEWIPRRRESR